MRGGEKLGLFDFFKANKQDAQTVSNYQMVVDQGQGFYSWNGKIYQSDIVKSAMRPKVQAIGKALAKHIRKGEGTDLKVNPEPYIRFLLEEPNEIMSMQMLLEKMANQLELNGNAFALIIRDNNNLPSAIYPIVCSQVEMVKNGQGELLIRFSTIGGKMYLFRYSDVIHLRKDYNENEFFGDSLAPSLTPLMEIVNTTDQGIVKAIKNSNVVRWLLKFNQVLRPEDIEKNTQKFVESFLSTDSEHAGAAGIDSKTDAQQVDPKDYVPNEGQMLVTRERIYSLFNTNDKIIQSKYSENEWISYYESQVEPVLMQLTSQFTIKLFTRRERGFGNSIMFESSALTFASMKTKLGLVALVDRGVLSRNEMREYFNLAPVEGGNEMILRLDTAVVRDGKGGEEIDEDD